MMAPDKKAMLEYERKRKSHIDQLAICSKGSEGLEALFKGSEILKFAIRNVIELSETSMKEKIEFVRQGSKLRKRSLCVHRLS